MFRLCLVMAALAALAGCVSTRTTPLAEGDIEKYRGGTVTYSIRAKPSFSAMTAGKAMFGMIGAAAMISAGNQIVEENEIADPAEHIREALLAELAQANDLTLTLPGDAIANTKDVNDLAKLYSSARLLLDVQTVNWSFTYFPTDFNNYRVIYSAKIRLIDTEDRMLLAEGFCNRVPDKTPEAPSRDELLEDSAARLKEELRIAADHCVNEFRTAVLRT